MKGFARIIRAIGACANYDRRQFEDKMVHKTAIWLFAHAIPPPGKIFRKMSLLLDSAQTSGILFSEKAINHMYARQPANP